MFLIAFYLYRVNSDTRQAPSIYCYSQMIVKEQSKKTSKVHITLWELEAFQTKNSHTLIEL